MIFVFLFNLQAHKISYFLNEIYCKNENETGKGEESNLSVFRLSEERRS